MIVTLFLVLTLLLQPAQESIWNCTERSEQYVGYAESVLGELKTEWFTSDVLDTLQGTEVDWYSDEFNNARFISEKAVYSTSQNIDYIYIVHDPDYPDYHIFYIMHNGWGEGEDGHPHGCGAYFVETSKLEWLTEPLWRAY